MNSTTGRLVPKLESLLMELGTNIRLARLRRKLSLEMVSERAGISRSTLQKIEKGQAGVSMGHYMLVLMVLGLEEDIRQVAADDMLGRKLQDSGLLVRKRAPKKSEPR